MNNENTELGELSKLVLISNKGCPFVQRSEIFLNIVGVKYTVETIDSQNKPDWFNEISPLGQVPVLRTGGKAIFGSVVINEFLDEFSGLNSLPKDVLNKAITRSWINFSEKIILNQGALFSAVSEEKYLAEFNRLRSGLEKLEEQLKGSKYFNGDTFSIIDASYAPFFIRFTYFNMKRQYDIFEGLPKISRWRDAILENDAVKNIYKEDVVEYYNSYCQKINAFFLENSSTNA